MNAFEEVEFVHKGFPRKHLLALHTNSEGVKALVQAIDDKLGKGAAKRDHHGVHIRHKYPHPFQAALPPLP